MTPRRTAAPAPRAPALHPVAAACGALLALIAAAPLQALAQAASSDNTVVITGIRRGIESSLATKRNSDSIVEAVSAEDIGKLPDISIAESLARLPGLAAQRVDGRAQAIQIRGLSGNYAGTLLNGREIVSTSDNRAAEFDQFPSELLGSVVVYKTPDAAVVAAGLSGTADMRTVRPLDFRGRQLAFNLRGEHNGNGQVTDGASANGKRFSVSYIDQFANNTVGVALGLAHLDLPGQERAYKSWWWANTGNWGRPVAGAPAGAITLNGFEALATASTQKRTGLMGVFEYKPHKDLHSTLDLYYSKFDQRRTMRGIMTNLGPTWNDATEPTVSDARVTTVNGDPILTHAVVGNLKPVVRNDYNTRDDTIAAIGWNTEVKAAGWTAVADLSYSRAKRNEQILEVYAGPATPSSLTIDVATGSGVSQITPALNYSSPTQMLLSDPAGWGHDGLIKYPHVTDEVKSLRLSAKRDLGGLAGLLSTVETGLNYTQRTKDVNKTEVNLNLKNGRTPVAVGSDLLRPATDLGFAGMPGGTLSYDIMPSIGRYYDSSPTALDQVSARHYDVKEDVTTLYGRLGLDTTVMSVPVRGNLGLQVVHASQHSNGFMWTGATAVPVAGGTSYTDILPSLNLVAELSGNRYLRSGLARTVARPRMEDMRAGITGVGVSNTTFLWSGSGGNAKLEPWRADSLDLAFEQYIGKRSYVSAATFYKKLRSFIYNKDIVYDFSGIPNPTANTPISNIGVINAPANGQGGMVAGFELAASVDLGVWSKALDGIGFTASYADTRSNLHEGNDVSKPLDGLSGRVNSLGAYYERDGFSARVSQRYRSAFVTTTRGVFLDGVTSRIEPEQQVDIQLGYAFEQGPYKGLSLLLQVNNLTNEPYRTRKGIDSGSATAGATLPERYTTWGRQVLFGVNYKM
ncbi:TonB-dependent receptor [Ideonella sp. DXS22W]|uniref:TonB-dependent receptor n=1 Tax=Pseudaquabacterium inlustre TaxID=2984192 RepID=A0ABU9CNI7_9BURK